MDQEGEQPTFVDQLSGNNSDQQYYLDRESWHLCRLGSALSNVTVKADIEAQEEKAVEAGGGGCA